MHLRGNGIVDEYHIIRHVCNLEVAFRLKDGKLDRAML